MQEHQKEWQYNKEHIVKKLIVYNLIILKQIYL